MTQVEVLRQEAPQACTESMPDAPLQGAIVWSRDGLAPNDGVLPIDAKVEQELAELMHFLRANPLPVVLLEASDFDLPASRALMTRARDSLEQGVGFAIIDRLPLDDLTVAETSALFWVLAQMVARPVAQSWDGKMTYDVRDTGAKPGYGVRPDVTNAEQNFHTDNSYNLFPPDYVALLCVRPALSGGINSIVSFYTVYNEMRRRHPELLARLHRPFLFDRQREHAEGDPPVLSHSLFEYIEGRLVCRLSRHQVLNGCKLAGVKLDAEGEAAIECLEAIMAEPAWNREFNFERGQIQIVDNIRCGHRRTQFIDYPEPERKRHLLRLWLRNRGRRFYNG